MMSLTGKTTLTRLASIALAAMLATGIAGCDGDDGKGVGFRLSGIYTGETRLDGSGLPGSTDLFFDDIVTFNLRVFANMGEVTGKNEGFLKDFRVSLIADNLFDAQRGVRDEAGGTPINYQPFVIDPLGLYLGIDLRKLF